MGNVGQNPMFFVHFFLPLLLGCWVFVQWINRYSDFEDNAQAAISMVQQALLLAKSEEGSASSGRKKRKRGLPPQVAKAKFMSVYVEV